MPFWPASRIHPYDGTGKPLTGRVANLELVNLAAASDALSPHRRSPMVLAMRCSLLCQGSWAPAVLTKFAALQTGKLTTAPRLGIEGNLLSLPALYQQMRVLP